MKLRKLNKKAGMESESIIIWIVVIAVVILAMVFISKMDFNTIIKNLPGVKGPGEEDKEIDTDLEIAICPEGYEIIGRFERGKSPSKLFIGIGDNEKESSIIYLPGKKENNIIIDKWGIFNEITLGDNIATSGTERKLEIKPKAFSRNEEIFTEILEQEIEKKEELFKVLLLIDNGIIKGNNQICQDSSRISEENMRKALNKLYWGVEEPETVDLIGSTTERITEDGYAKEGYYRLDLSPYITDRYRSRQQFLTGGWIESYGFYIKEEEENYNLYLFYRKDFSKEGRIDLVLVGSINNVDGRVSLFCDKKGVVGNNPDSSSCIITEGTLRLPDKVIFKNRGTFGLRCNTSIFLSSAAIHLAMSPLQEYDSEQNVFNSHSYSGMSEGNSIPITVTSN